MLRHEDADRAGPHRDAGRHRDANAPSLPASLSGTVTDQNGVPLPGLFLTCAVSKGPQYATTNSTAPVGFYTIAGLTAGPATLTVQQQGTSDQSAFSFTLEPGANTKNVTVTAYHGAPATAAGVVTVGGKPLAGATVTLEGKSAVTDSTGAYVLAGLQAGYWGIDVEWPPYGEAGFNVTLLPGPNVVDVRVP